MQKIENSRSEIKQENKVKHIVCASIEKSNVKCDFAEGSRLFFLGHMVWAYILAWTSARALKIQVSIPAVLLLGVLPDIDLFLAGFGVVHHSFTHSLFFWVILFTPLYLTQKRWVLPLLVAVTQHYAFGDFIVGSVMFLWPF
ncbi:MAG: hypothetical protein ACFFCW_48450, partial [Candidatus Hodarchaeota archaeon]